MAEVETPVTTPVAETPPAAPVAQADPDESQAVEVGGAKMVPLDALKAARAEAKGYKEKAAKADQLEQYVTAAKPYIDVLAANPQILAQQRPQQQAPADADPELVEIAQSLDYYDKDGKPDLTRAAKHQKLVWREAAKVAQSIVGPVAHTADEQRSIANWQHFSNQKLPDGQPVDQKTLAKYWRSLPVQQTANPQAAYSAFALAAYEQMSGRVLPNQPAAPANPPLVTEATGGGPARGKPMTDIERAVTAARGIKEEDYGKLTKGFTAGRTSPLED